MTFCQSFLNFPRKSIKSGSACLEITERNGQSLPSQIAFPVTATLHIWHATYVILPIQVWNSLNSSQMLFCDGCDLATYHMACLLPPIENVPDDDWYCPVCEQVRCFLIDWINFSIMNVVERAYSTIVFALIKNNYLRSYCTCTWDLNLISFVFSPTFLTQQETSLEKVLRCQGKLYKGLIV